MEFDLVQDQWDLLAFAQSTDFGSRFFGPTEMKAFHSIIHAGIERGTYDGQPVILFITSEQFVGLDGKRAKRLYSVRWMNAEGRIGSISKDHRTQSNARLEMMDYIAGQKQVRS